VAWLCVNVEEAQMLAERLYLASIVMCFIVLAIVIQLIAH
jgi:hypothetical protein